MREFRRALVNSKARLRPTSSPPRSGAAGIDKLEKQIGQAAKAHPDFPIFDSFPGAGSGPGTPRLLAGPRPLRRCPLCSEPSRTQRFHPFSAGVRLAPSPALNTATVGQHVPY
jgi:hypothetical protein